MPLTDETVAYERSMVSSDGGPLDEVVSKLPKGLVLQQSLLLGAHLLMPIRRRGAVLWSLHGRKGRKFFSSLISRDTRQTDV